MIGKFAMIASVGALLGGGSAALAVNDIIAVSWGGSVYTIDSSTGVGVVLGSSGFSQLNASARAADGTIYASSGLSSTAIISIDPNTGAGTLVVNSNLGSCRGMAFANDGRLFAIEDAGFVSDNLYTIDLSTGNKTFIGATGMPGLQGLAVDPTTGRMYGWDVGSGSGIGAGLVAIDLNTGAATDVDPNTPGSGSEVQGIGFDSAGNLFGSRDALYSINLLTGATALIGSGGYTDTRGMDFLGAGGFTIRLSGQCPGQKTLSWSGAGSGQMGIILGNGPGNFVIPGGPCQGTQLGLSGPGGLQLYNIIGTMGGQGQVTATVGTGACGKWVQCIKTNDCSTSNATGPI